MKRIVKTVRFGDITIDQQHILHFRDGMIGFHQLKDYFLVESPSLPLLLWLQSVDSPEVAFPIMEPYFFKKDYETPLIDADKFALSKSEGDTLKTFLVMTIPVEIERMTVNMKAPVMINLQKRTGTQVIQQDKNLLVRKPAFEIFNELVSSFELSQGPVVTQETSEPAVETWTAIDLYERDAGVNS
jgi:flagellar assembly factor FliW